MTSFTVGSRVRVLLDAGTSTRRRQQQRQRRGMIATLSSSSSACVLLEDLHNYNDNNNEVHSFIIAPKHKNTAIQANEEEEDVEVNVSFDKLSSLLPFEMNNNDNTTPDSLSTSDCKAYGDELLKLGDALAAMLYYERGLQKASQWSVGSTIVFKQKGFTKLAEVDCIEDDDDDDEKTNTTTSKSLLLDIRTLEGGDDLTISKQDVLIGILDSDDERLQERILLNLARCCLQLADDPTTADSHNTKQQAQFLKSAILATTLAMNLDDYHCKDDTSLSATTKTALTLRAKTHLSLLKFDHAKADLKRLLEIDPQHKEGQRLLLELERTKLTKKKAEKKLVRELCRWVDVVTKTSVSSEDDGKIDSREASTTSNVPSLSSSNTSTHSATALSYLFILIAVLVAYYIHTQL